MAEDGGTDDGVVVNNHFAGKFCGVANDDVVAQFAVMGYVYVFHQQVVAADTGSAL